MARSCPVGFDAERLRAQVIATYDRVAEQPDGEFHFHRGAAYAAALLGYDPNELARLPQRATARFAGVGNPLAIGPLHAGETVLDHACGAGTDLLLAARRVGPYGRAIGVDMTPGMRGAAALAAVEAGLHNVDVLAGVFEALPLPDASVDVVISNGVVNLAPDKARVFAEVLRVLRPGGRLYLADVALARELSLTARNNPDLWAACVAGALPESELLELTAEIGFEGGRITARFDSFRNTSAEARVSRDVQVHAVNFYAEKP
jgi:SAM-dependent methyltransferase